MELTSKQKKRIISDSRMMRPRVHLGLYGVTDKVIEVFKRSFDRTVVKESPTEVVRVKMQKTFGDDPDEAAKTLSSSNGSVFIAQDAEYLVFYKPKQVEVLSS